MRLSANTLLFASLHIHEGHRGFIAYWCFVSPLCLGFGALGLWVVLEWIYSFLFFPSFCIDTQSGLEALSILFFPPSYVYSPRPFARHRPAIFRVSALQHIDIMPSVGCLFPSYNKPQYCLSHNALPNPFCLSLSLHDCTLPSTGALLVFPLLLFIRGSYTSSCYLPDLRLLSSSCHVLDINFP